jgi:hypothetical protein
MSETTLQVCHKPDEKTPETITPEEAVRRLNNEIEKAAGYFRKDQINAHHMQCEITRVLKILTREKAKKKKKKSGPDHYKGARFADSEPLDIIPMLQKPASYRKQLLATGGCHCAYCNCKLSQKSATIDHVQPLSRGGENRPDNMILACYRCNQSKGSRTVIEWAADILAVHK